MSETSVKRFYAKIPGSAFIFSDGTRAVFAHGFLDLSEQHFPGVYKFPDPKIHDVRNGRKKWEVYMEELETLIQEGNPMIFTQETVKNVQDLPKIQADQNAYSEAAISAQDAVIAASARGKMVATGDQNDGVVRTAAPNDVNVSTVDPGLQSAMLAVKVAGAQAMASGMKVEAMRRLQGK